MKEFVFISAVIFNKECVEAKLALVALNPIKLSQ